MNLTKHLPVASHQRRCRLLWWAVAAAIVAIIVLVVPLAVILPRKHRFHSTTVMVPLYIYPDNQTSWDPMFSAAETHPDVSFLVVVNPNSGPGNTTLPSDDYVSAIDRLNSLDNVQTVGYVRTGYASRDVADVVREVNIYAGWSSAANSSTNLTIHGIFFDEAPHEYSASAVTFLQTVDAAARNASGIQGAKTIIHNPGVVPADEILKQTDPDVTVIFEESYSVWQQRASAVKAKSSSRTKNCVMVNSVPTSDNTTLSDFVYTLSASAEYVFVTDRTTSYYEYFADDWDEFTSVIRVHK